MKQREPKNCKICGAPFMPKTAWSKYCTSCREKINKPKYENCLFCGKKLKRDIRGYYPFCNDMCQLMHNMIYRKILSLPIAEPTKSEVLALWRIGEVHTILDKLATYELQNRGIIKA